MAQTLHGPETSSLFCKIRTGTAGSAITMETLTYLVDDFAFFARSTDFRDFCIKFRLNAPEFRFHPPTQSLLHRFHGGLARLPPHIIYGVCIVFHGTSAENIGKIQLQGLDAALRKRQAYGPGEYFGMTPLESLPYCCGGNQMLVFLVVIPLAVLEKTKPALPVVVVSTADHQLPIGTVKFKVTLLNTLSRSSSLGTPNRHHNGYFRIARDLERGKMVHNNEIQLLVSKFICIARGTEFTDFCTRSGLIRPEFEYRPLHPYLWERFHGSIRCLPKDCSIGLVFYGAGNETVDEILCKGLTLSTRKEQELSPGDCFSKNPCGAVSHCHGGNRMLVFLVLVPAHAHEMSVSSDHVVVSKSAHQLPIGVVKFKRFFTKTYFTA